jgi:NADP-dependent 3-hydroxy acid dehydrogenase YdfG
MHITRILAPAMAKHDGGTIINIGSVAGIKPIASQAGEWHSHLSRPDISLFS